MLKVVIFICMCYLAFTHGQGYDQAAESHKPVEEEKHRGEGYVGHNPSAAQQEINHEWSFSGKSPMVPSPPQPAMVHGDGPAPASYPPLTPHDINTASYSGKGGYQVSPPASANAPGYKE